MKFERPLLFADLVQIDPRLPSCRSETVPDGGGKVACRRFRLVVDPVVACDTGPESEVCGLLSALLTAGAAMVLIAIAVLLVLPDATLGDPVAACKVTSLVWTDGVAELSVNW